MVYATRKFTFAAAHRYWREEWSAEENARVFGNLTVPHGHNYVLEATVRGSVDADGMVMDVAVLEQAMRSAVVNVVDHRDLTQDVPALAGTVTTGENLASAFYRMIDRVLPPERLVRVAVVETENNRFEYEATGETP